MTPIISSTRAFLVSAVGCRVERPGEEGGKRPGEEGRKRVKERERERREEKVLKVEEERRQKVRGKARGRDNPLINTRTIRAN